MSEWKGPASDWSDIWIADAPRERLWDRIRALEACLAEAVDIIRDIASEMDLGLTHPFDEKAWFYRIRAFLSNGPAGRGSGEPMRTSGQVEGVSDRASAAAKPGGVALAQEMHDRNRRRSAENQECGT